MSEMNTQAGPVDQLVKVLYDYEYNDEIDNRKIWMNEGEIFTLLNTESKEWWEVCRAEQPDNPFYVPSTYVELLNTGQANTVSNDHPDHLFKQNGGQLNSFGSKDVLTSFTNKVVVDERMDSNQGSSDYMNVNVETFKMNHGSNKDSFTVQCIPNRPTSFGDGGDYANLDEFRQAANIPNPSQSNLPTPPQSPEESDYANVESLNLHAVDPSPPVVENCEFKKTLMDTWDQYLDPTTNRLFYQHNKTNEIQWKPPRGQYHNELKNKRLTSSRDYEEVIIEIPAYRQNRKSRSVDFGMPRLKLETSIPDGWSFYVDDQGEDVFIDNATNEKRSGGSSPTKSPTSDPGDAFAESQFAKKPAEGDQRSRATKVSDRFQKSRSVMIENLHFHAPMVNTGPPPPKSATLPPNFTASIPESTRDNTSRNMLSLLENLNADQSPSNPANDSQSRFLKMSTQVTYGAERVKHPVEDEGAPRNLTPDNQQSQPFSQSVNLNEPIEGTLNKCKIPNSKNAAKKSAKKWAYAYVKLSGSNLLLYKDQKSTTPTKNQPHGKYEQIVALVTCSVEKDPKIFTSKKNTICITSPEHHILLQADDHAKITEWFVKLHTKIQELGGTPDPPVPEEGLTTQLSVPAENELGRKSSFKDKGHSRKGSEGGTLERKGKVRDYLSKFMTTRSDKDKLVKKGIYKDAVFGSEIKSLCDKEKSKVPSFVVRSIEAIEKRGLDHEGLYRIGGNVSQIQKLRCMVDQGEKYDLDDPQWDINILAGCLKLFFRELKEPLFTFPLFDRFLKSFLKESASDRLKAIKATMNELPKNNYETVKVLFTHLINVMDNHLENKMHAHQLAIVFGPTLIWPEVQSGNLATSMVYQSRIVEFVLIEYKNIFR